MGSIRYVTGDATDPPDDGLDRVIVHCCNNEGGWGKGFVVALSARWPEPEADYRALAWDDRALGSIRVVPVGDRLFVCNLIGQAGYRRAYADRPDRFVRYDAIADGLQALLYDFGTGGWSAHMPRMGAGLAGGDWRVIEAVVESTLCDAGVPVTVYDLPA